MNVNLKDFVTTVLKHYNKSLYEWREDVIRPKLAMTKLCGQRVHITPEDLQAAFDAYYGEKVECRLIVWPQEQKNKVINGIYAKIRDDEQEFDNVATHQATPQLAASGGRLDHPIGHHTTGDDELEKAAFSLRPGELSPVLDTHEGIVVVKCVRRIPPDSTKKLETERPILEKEVFERKLQREMPVLFKELRDKAQPMLFLKKETNEADLKREVQQELQSSAPAKPITPPSEKPPQGN
jgi:hypothetical protein